MQQQINPQDWSLDIVESLSSAGQATVNYENVVTGQSFNLGFAKSTGGGVELSSDPMDLVSITTSEALAVDQELDATPGDPIRDNPSELATQFLYGKN